MTNHPTGTVTFLFSDIQGSTKIAQAYPDQWEALRGRHHEILRGAIQANNGYVFKIVGDEFCCAFHSAPDALKAALAAQQGLQSEDWQPAAVKVRMGINTGAAQLENPADPRSDYTGYSALARVSRVMAAGHGGQVLVSNASAEAVRAELPETVSLLDMGEHRMKGLLNAEHLWQVAAPGLESDFPPLKTLTSMPDSMAEQIASFVEREKGIAVGLEKLETELPRRAPVLMDRFNEIASYLRPSAIEHTRQERFEALTEMNNLCMEALDISFIVLCTGEEPPAYDARCPFRGLESFRPEDSEFFFGREALIKKLVGKLEAHPFLAVLGASGSGKSSLVMAGLIPALEAEYVIFRPGSDPLGGFASAVAAVKENALIVVDQFEETFTLTTDEEARKEFISKLLNATRRYKIVVTLRSDFLGEVAAHRALNDQIQNHLENVPPMDMDELYQSMAGQAGRTSLQFEGDLGQQILNDVVGEPGAMPLLQHALWMLWKRRHGSWLKVAEYQSFGGVRQAIASTAEDVYAACAELERERIRDIFLRLTRLDESNEGRDTRRRVALGDLIPVGRDSASSILLLDILANARLIVKTLHEDQTEIEVAHEALIRYWERLREWLNEDRDKLRLRESVGEYAKEWDKAGRDEALLNHRGGRLDDAALLANNPRYGLTSLEQEYLNECVALRSKEQVARERRLRLTVSASIVAAAIFLALGVFGWLQRNEATKQASVAQANAEVAQQAQGVAQEAQVVAQQAQVEAEQQAEKALAGSLAAQADSLKGNDHALALLLGMEAYRHEDSLLTRTTLFQLLQFSPYTQLFGYQGPVSSVAVSPDGTVVASSSCREYSNNQCKYGEIVLTDTVNHHLLAKLSGKYGIVNSLAFRQSGKTLLLAAGGCVPVDDQNKGCTDNKGQITLWDVAQAALLADLRSGHSALVKTVAFNRAGSMLASGSFDTKIILWNISDPAKPVMEGAPLQGHASFVNSLTFNADDSVLVSAGDDKRIMLWDVSQPKAAVQIGTPIEEHTAAVNSIAFSADGAKFASASDDKTVILWDWNSTSRSLTKPLKLEGHGGYVKSVAFNADGTILASVGFDFKAILWNVGTGAQIGLPLSAHTRAINAAAFGMTKDAGPYLFTGSDDRTVIRWDLSTRQLLSQPVKTMSPPPGLGVTAVSGELTAKVVEQEIQLGGRSEPLAGHTSTVNSLSFSPQIDGRLLLASASDDQTVILWDVTDVSAAAVFLKLENFDNPVNAAYFDGKQLITIEKNGRSIRWNVAPSEWLPLACDAARRNLTALEWERFLPTQSYQKTCEFTP